jgi:transcriptional regulator with XRE-family HTH domain
MEQQNTSIGLLMKAARKFKKFNQSEVAQAIGCSQSALSKMEHNLLIPNAPQWFLFSRFTAIPPETIESGIIDRHTRVKLNNDAVSLGFKLPKRYRLNRAQKVREVYPFLFYLEKKGDIEVLNQFMSNVGIDPEFFLDYDNLINFQLIVDLTNVFIRLGLTAPADIAPIVEFGQNNLYWDKFGEIWSKLKGPKELFVEFSLEQPFFQADFKIQVEYVGNKLMVSFIPEPHLYHFLKDVTQEVTEWLNIYRKLTLEFLARKTLGVNVEVRSLPELANSPLESRFEIN